MRLPGVLSFLSLAQSLLLKLRSAAHPFPQAPVNEEIFGNQRWQDVASQKEVACVADSLKAMLFSANQEPGKVPDIIPEDRIGYSVETLYNAWQDTGRTITFFTSGSTGKPKACVHTLEMLNQEADFLKPYFSNIERILSVVPAHHLYGFTFSVFLPKACDIPVKRSVPLPHVLSSIMEPGDAIIGIPLFWESFLKTTSHLPGQRIAAVSASAPIKKETLIELEKEGFDIIDIFGSSENGVLGIRTSSNDAYTLLPHFTKRQAGSIARRWRDGELSEVILEDSMEWSGKRKFIPLGRCDKAVQVAGVNVYPEAVAAKIRNLPGIKDCAVRLMRPDEGYRLKAFIIPVEGECPVRLRRMLRHALKKSLSVEECPVAFTFGTSLPKNEMGKLADW